MVKGQAEPGPHWSRTQRGSDRCARRAPTAPEDG
jgi:hypothetical protein